MKQATETRELIVLGSPGSLLRCTFHKTGNESGIPETATGEQNRVGILFLNSLTLPRTANGDSAVYWAEAFAASGYPSFRVDLPGLGDSDGDVRTDMLDFINAGGYASVVSAAAKEIVQRFALPGIVILGHCAGAVSALFSAAAAEDCKGLVLIDPYFHLPKAVRPKVRSQLTEWASRSILGGFLSDAFDVLKHIHLFLRGNTPPKNANRPLLNHWKVLASSGMPILVLKAPAPKANAGKPRVGEFDYLDYVTKLAGRRSGVVFRFIADTDHTFANRRGRAAVRQ